MVFMLVKLTVFWVLRNVCTKWVRSGFHNAKKLLDFYISLFLQFFFFFVFLNQCTVPYIFKYRLHFVFFQSTLSGITHSQSSFYSFWQCCCHGCCVYRSFLTFYKFIRSPVYSSFFLISSFSHTYSQKKIKNEINK